MSEPKDPKAPQRSDQPTAVGTQGGDKRSGRVSHDSRGNPVWEWQLETGVYTRDVNTQKLRKLDLGDLSLAETASHKKLPDDGAQDPRAAGKKMPGGGFNPYDNAPTRESGGFNPYDNAHTLGNKMRGPPATPPPARKPTDLKKLEEWMKLKKRVEQDKDED